MNCTTCGADTVVIEARPAGADNRMRRRRKCTKCGHRHTTLEVPLEEARAVLGARSAVRFSLMQASAELKATLERVRSLQEQFSGELDTEKIAGEGSR